MKKDKILISKDNVPYVFDILLADELFTLTVAYNSKHDFFTVALEKDGEMVCEGEPIVYGIPLFHDIFQTGYFPAIDIIPLDESGEQSAVTFKSLNETVFLTVDNVGGDDIG